MSKPVVIAEIGCNHKGDMAIAHKMIKLLGTFKLLNENSYIDIVKFQKRTNKELLTPEEYNAPHPNPANSYGKTYGEHREFLEFNLEQNRQLKEWCEEEELKFLSKKNFKEEMIKIGAVYTDKESHKNEDGYYERTFWVKGFSLSNNQINRKMIEFD